MADGPYDHSPSEQRARIVCHAFEDFEASIRDAVSSLQLALNDPLDMPFGECFYTTRDKAHLRREQVRQARAAVAQFVKDPAVFLPDNLSVAYDLPEVEA